MAAADGVEQLVRRDRLVIAAGLTLICVLAWVWVMRGAGMGMTALEMTRTGLFPHLGQPLRPMEMQAPLFSGPVGTFLLMTLMWWIMMIAMMLPSAAPMLLLYARVARHQNGRSGAARQVPAHTGSFLAGYLTIWLIFSVVAVLLQMALVAMGALSEMMLWSVSPWLSAALLAGAAAYQLTPIRAACLDHCRNPVHWLSRNWRRGGAGAFRMGLVHGSYCAGCCWALMLLLFVGGVMNVFWIAALAIIVLIEKLAPPGFPSGRISAALLGLWAVATVLV